MYYVVIGIGVGEYKCGQTDKCYDDCAIDTHTPCVRLHDFSIPVFLCT